VPPRLARLFAVAVTAALLLTTACSDSGTSPASGDGEQAAAAAAEVDPADLEPDKLPDPQVAPGTCKVVTYTPSTARESQRGELCRPADDQRDVVVMVVHGGSGIGGSYQGMRSWADRLLAEGYVTFVPDYHLFTPGSGGPVFPWPEQNVKAAAQYLRGTARALGVSRRNMVVQGMSAGARLGAVAYTTPNDPWFAGPELWPDIPDTVNGFIGFYHTYDGTMQYSSQYYGGPDDSETAAVRERWDKADALANAADAEGPALFITGSRDWDLIVTHQDAFASALRDAGQDAETVVITGGSHGFDTGTATRLSRLGEQAATEVLEWLNEQFPQDPSRPAMSADVDLASAPERTGEPPTTYQTRRRPSPSRSTTTTTRRAGSTTTTSAPATSSTASTTTVTTVDPPTTSSSTTTTQDVPSE
jgi:acetyl esterase/lipase